MGAFIEFNSLQRPAISWTRLLICLIVCNSARSNVGQKTRVAVDSWDTREISLPHGLFWPGGNVIGPWGVLLWGICSQLFDHVMPVKEGCLRLQLNYVW